MNFLFPDPPPAPARAADPAERFARVAVALPVDRALHYRIPPALAADVRVGARVRVRVAGRQVGGTVIAIDAVAEVARVLDLEAVLPADARVEPELIGLCRWVADRYGASLGETLESALPPVVRSGRGVRQIAVVRLAPPFADPARARLEATALLARHEKQARLLRLLAEADGAVKEIDLLRRAQVGPSPLQSLVKRGCATRERVEDPGDPAFLAAPVARAEPPRPTPEQVAAVRAIELALDARSHRGFLLLGVTGSGKTEVYLRALAAALARGRRGIVLVPEIALTPQTVARFRARFERVALLHSALAEKDRLREWRRIAAGDVDVVIGARSAIFAPIPDLGLILIDEEHEPSFKQQNPPRYHAREVALERARRAGAVVVLGSATPALESWVAARDGRLTLLRLPHRVGGGELPATTILDLSHLPFTKHPSLLTDRLRAAIGEVLRRREQAILFLNRRGFARIALCPGCKEAAQCPQCDVALVLHQRAERLICHLCGREQAPSAQCGKCGQPGVRFLGFGTERVESELRREYPRARIARMDSDTTAAQGAHERILGAFARGEHDLLVGTQMIAKGLDFPRVTLVGIVSADTSLSLPDWRASERTFQLVAQVAGRAGRAARGGRVLVQTLHPHHPAITCAVRHDYEAFVASELPLRQETAYPPFSEVVRILVSHPDLARTRAAATKARDKLAPMAGEHGVALLGPAPCPIERVRGRWRWQLLLKCPQSTELTRVVAWARERVAQGAPVRITLDVDPGSML
ncbi:MAG: primosomal protein N' [Planctomycetes bacterium]|nr:primosomal protein N' [Planctomycetota bacterium]